MRAARRLILLLHRLEVESCFRCVPVYIRTYRNQLADWVSREEISRVRAELLEAGWWESVFQEDWSQLIEDARFGPLTLPGERGATAQLARQLMAHGTGTSLPKRIWIQYPWEVVYHGPSGTSSALQALVRHGHSASSAGQYLWTAISQDPRGTELARTLEAVDRARADGRLRVIIIDLPRQANVSYRRTSN